MNLFFTSQFNYCPFVGMLHSRPMYGKINHLYERCTCIVCSDKASFFEKTFRNTDLYQYILEIYRFCVQYNFYQASAFSLPNVKSTFHGTERLPYRSNFSSKGVQGTPNLSALKRKFKNGNLKIALLIDYVKSRFKVLASFDTFSDVLDFL